MSETRLWVSSNPSSFNSCEISLLDESGRKASFALHSRSGVGDFKLLMASRTSSWLILLMLFPIFPIRDTTSLFVLFFDSLLCVDAGSFESDLLLTDPALSSTLAVKLGKLTSLIESGDVVVAFVALSSVALLRSTGRLNLRVRLADENLSN